MVMKNIIYFASAVLLALSSCKNEDGLDGNGTLKLSVGIEDIVNVESRSATDDQSSLESTCKVRIYSGNTLVDKYLGSQLPVSIPLLSGDYSVRVTAGDSVAAAFDKKFYEGIENFTIVRGHTSEVNVDCRIANTVVAVNFDPTLDDMFSESSVVVTSSTGELVYSSSENNVKGYFSLPSDNKTLKCVFKGKKITGGEFTKEHDIQGEPSTLYNLTYKFSSSPSDTGGGFFDISVDTTPLGESSSMIVVKQRPTVTLKNEANEEFDINNPHTVQVGTTEPFYLWVATSSSIKSLVVTNDKFVEWGVSSTSSIDFTGLSDDEVSQLSAKGLTLIEYTPGTTTNGVNWCIKFESALMTKITVAEGNFNTTIDVVDVNDKSRNAVWNLVVSNSTVVTTDAFPYTIWTNKAQLRASKISEPTGNVRFRYRQKNTVDWSYVDAVLANDVYTADIKGLTPKTMYEYQIMDGDVASSVTCMFTTEEAQQLPNSSFESVSGDEPLLIYGEGEEMWWDSGNHGSASFASLGIGGNVTTVDKSLFHSGIQSLLLASQNIANTLAAGNVFAGKYLKTEGTNGVLGFGRLFTSRPAKLKGYVKYNGGTVDIGGDMIAKGSDDKGIFYVALTDGDGEVYDDGSKWSRIIKTNKKNRQLFDKDAENVIAYGEMIWSGKTSDNGLVPFEITLNYKSLERIPNRIVVVASACMYGDYFQGSSSSKMWLDDLELVYE